MSANVEFFVDIDKIEVVRQDVKQFSKLAGGNYYDKDGNEIDVYYRRHWQVVDRLIFFNNKEISLNELEKKFKSRNPSFDVEFSLGQGKKTMLLISCHVDDNTQLLVLIGILSEFLYDIFDKEVEF